MQVGMSAEGMQLQKPIPKENATMFVKTIIFILQKHGTEMALELFQGTILVPFALI